MAFYVHCKDVFWESKHFNRFIPLWPVTPSPEIDNLIVCRCWEFKFPVSQLTR